MTPAAVFWLVTWAVFWWHLCRWLIRAAVIGAAVRAVQAAKKEAMAGGK